MRRICLKLITSTAGLSRWARVSWISPAPNVQFEYIGGVVMKVSVKERIPESEVPFPRWVFLCSQEEEQALFFHWICRAYIINFFSRAGLNQNSASSNLYFTVEYFVPHTGGSLSLHAVLLLDSIALETHSNLVTCHFPAREPFRSTNDRLPQPSLKSRELSDGIP